ncbi:MAG: SEC-C domain-containing protein [Nitrosomonadales bacterium]|nr:SEC-C domain-containing protein [Nitrosomonadales bacterium]
MAPGRNDPCSCGSGKKYKQCCMGKAALSAAPGPMPAETAPLVALFNAGKHAEVENRALALLHRYPGSGTVWKILGAALQLQGKDALPALQKATELSPDNAEAHYNLAVARK